LARTILLADDSVTAQNMGRRILTDAGYEVITVNNGSAALKKIAEHKPDLIVLDVYMPGYGGLEVCNRLKESRETARIPVLLTVGKLEPFKPDEARRVRADAFIVKPFEASELLTALTKLEDKIVPQSQPQKPGRFARALASIEASEGDGFGDTETGWKERLNIPPVAKPKATETNSAPETTASDLGRAQDFKPAEPSQRFDRPIPAGLPADITPEEIAAITAAAATIEGKEAAAPVVPAEVETKSEPPAEQAASEPASTANETPAVVSATPVGSETPANVVEAAAEEPPAATLATAGPDATVAEPAEPQAVAKAELEAAAVAAPTPSESAPEIPATREREPVSADSSAAEAAVAAGEKDMQPEPAEAAAGTQEKPWARDAEVLAAIASLVPSADELAKSLEQESAVEPQPREPALVGAAAAHALAESVVAIGARWVAEPVALAEGDASINLQLEMEKSFAASTAETARATTQTVEVPMAGSGVASVAVADVQPAADVRDPEIAAEVQHTVVAKSEVRVEAAYAAAAANGSSTEVVTPVEAATATTAPADTAAADDGEKLREVEMAAAWQNWKQIRESIVGSQLTAQIADVAAAGLQAEAAKSAQAEPKEAVREDVEEENGNDSSSEPDAISSIVDSVLAELKPKLMEEIARKMNSDKEKKSKGKKKK